MNKNYQYKPFQFFIIAYSLTWTTWFIAAYFSLQSGKDGLQMLFMSFGLFAPAIATLYMYFSSGSRKLKADFWNRIIQIRRIKWEYMPYVILLMPVVIIFSILISVLFGMPIQQLHLAKEFKIINGKFMLNMLIVFLAPALEDLAWRGYGMDSIRSKFNMLPATIYFSILWALWHLPLFFIKGYYHNNLWNTSIIYVVNFFVSVLPLTIIMNWLYYRNNRSILVCVIFHIMAVLSSEMFQIEEMTKCVVTGVMLVISMIIIITNDDLFFSQKKTFKEIDSR